MQSNADKQPADMLYFHTGSCGSIGRETLVWFGDLTVFMSNLKADFVPTLSLSLAVLEEEMEERPLAVFVFMY